MDRIKSAREIALEKVAGLGKASPEELRRIKEQESAPVGEALANRYLAGGYGWREVESSLARSGDKRDFVARSLLNRLVASLGSGDNSRALHGIESLAADKAKVQQIGDRLLSLSEAHRHRRQRELDSIRSEIEPELRQELEQAGISGSAVQPIPERDPRWQQAQRALDTAFQSEIDQLKRDLLQAVGVVAQH